MGVSFKENVFTRTVIQTPQIICSAELVWKGVW